MSDRYWVGGGDGDNFPAGYWDDISHWSTSSGGSGGASIPTILDNVIFDENSDATLGGYAVASSYSGNIPVCYNFTVTNCLLRITIEKLNVYGIISISNYTGDNGSFSPDPEISFFYGLLGLTGIQMYGSEFHGGGTNFSCGITFNNNCAIYDSNDFGLYPITFVEGTTITFEAGTTQTILTDEANPLMGLLKISTDEADGTSLVTFVSSSPGNSYTISANYTDIKYCDVSDCIAAGAGIPFDDTIGGVNNGNNTNWLFPPSPSASVSPSESASPSPAIPFELEGEPMQSGVYTLGRHSTSYPLVLDFTYPISERNGSALVLDRVEIGSILVDGQNVYVAWKRLSSTSITYGIDKLDYDNKLSGAYIETRVLSGNREQFGNFSKMVVSYAELPTGTNITLQYSKDYGTTWTNMTTKDDTARKLLYCEEEFEASSVAYRAVITATGNDAPAIERADIVLR